MPRRKGRTSGEADERRRVGKGKRGPLAADRMAKREGEQVGQKAAEDDVEEDRRPAPVERRDRRDDEEDRALDADPRKRDEDLVEPVDPVVDDPALEP
jgi:hypothetical protein